MAVPVRQLQKERTEKHIDQECKDNNNPLVFYCLWFCRKTEEKEELKHDQLWVYQNIVCKISLTFYVLSCSCRRAHKTQKPS